MNKTEEKFKALFKNQRIKEIKFYNVSENYLVFDPNHKWVIEGGIEFIFELNVVCLAWNSEMQLYEMIQGEIKELSSSLDIYEMDLAEHPNIKPIIGKKVEDIEFNWTFYQKMDENMETSEEKTYIPQELRIKFEDNINLQIATVVFQIKDQQMTNLVYDPQSAILITYNHPVEIKEIA